MVWTEKEKIMLVSGSYDKKSRKRERVRGGRGGGGQRRGEREHLLRVLPGVQHGSPVHCGWGLCSHEAQRPLNASVVGEKQGG